jgi:hypothetical protein
MVTGRDGRHFVYLVRSNDESKRGIYIAAPDDPAGRRLLSDWSGVVYAPKRTDAVAPDERFLANVSTDVGQPAIEVITNWQKLAAGAKTQ